MYKKNIFYYIERHFKKLFTVIITGELTNSIYTENPLSLRWTLMILHLLRMRRNVNRNVFNDRENVSATAPLNANEYCMNEPKCSPPDILDMRSYDRTFLQRPQFTKGVVGIFWVFHFLLNVRLDFF